MIWDTFQEKKLDTFEHRGDTRAAQFSSDGQQFAIARPRDFQVWRENAPQTVSFQCHLGHPNSVTFTQSGKTLVSGHTAGSGIVFWNMAEKRAQQSSYEHSAAFYHLKGGLAVSPMREFLAASYTKPLKSGCCISYPIMTFTDLSCWPASVFAYSECFVSTTTDGALYMWDVNRWEKRDPLYGHTEYIRALAFHPDGKILVRLHRMEPHRCGMSHVEVYDFASVSMASISKPV